MANLKNLKPAWKKGESGNPKGGKKKPPTMKEMVEILPELPLIFAKVLSEKKGDMTLIEAGIRRTALSWVNQGNINAGRLILEYAYGKPKDGIEAINQAITPPQITVNISKEAIDKLK
jgi:hypothetical protein